MATKIELTIAPNYAPGWGIIEAVRELFQNALDQQTETPENEMDWSYDGDEQKLIISNKTSTLTVNTLLLGATTKAGNVHTIGQFGEGYKIATLVLLRNNKQITFYNYGAKEIWKPRFVKSRKFGTGVLTFFIEKVSVWKTVPDANLTIEVSGITREEWENEIVPSNLHLQYGNPVVASSDYGDVLDQQGRVYVNGLYVCEYPPYKYGYNFKPEHIELDRDRKMVSDFDLKWAASRFWANSSLHDKALELVEAGHADVAYVSSMCATSGLSDAALHKFRERYGPKAIPVTTQDAMDAVPSGYRGVIVPGTYCELVKGSSEYEAPRMVVKFVSERLEEWLDKINEKYTLDQDEIDEFNKLIDEL